MHCAIFLHPSANAARLGDAFVEALGRRLSVAEIGEVRRRNARRPDDRCASHDFCDADAVMAAAFEQAIGRRARPCCPTDRWLIRAAWRYAQKTSLTGWASR